METRSSERTEYEKIRNNVVQPKDRIDRIENMVVSGMPDINFCSGGVECWIELKAPKEPKRKTTALFGSNHKLSQEQKNWFLRQKQAGGKGYIIIATEKRLVLFPGELADTINELTVEEIISVSVWSKEKPLRKKEWQELRENLRKR